MGGKRAIDPRLDKSAVDARVHQPSGDKAVSSANVKKDSVAEETSHHTDDAPVAMAEPERVVLYLQAGGVALRGIGDRRLRAGEPYAGVAQFQRRRQGRYISLD